MRSEYEIIRDILLAANDKNMTDLCYKSGINYTTFKRLMPRLVDRGLVSTDSTRRIIYTITNKGMLILGQIDQLVKELAP